MSLERYVFQIKIRIVLNQINYMNKLWNLLNDKNKNYKQKVKIIDKDIKKILIETNTINIRKNSDKNFILFIFMN